MYLYNNNLLHLLTIVTIFFFLYVKWKHSYWKRRGLEYDECDFFFGNSKNVLLQKESIIDSALNVYKKFKPLGLKCIGRYSFLSPVCVILDPTLVKNIVIKDFLHFHNRGFYLDEENDPLSGSILNLEDEKWKNLRTKLNPAFTSRKMKMMFEMFLKCGNDLTNMMTKYADTGESVNIKDVSTCFTVDVIGSCAFGLECRSIGNLESDFFKFAKRVVEPKDLLEKLNPFLAAVVPNCILRLFGYKTTKPDVESFFKNMIGEIVDYREKNNVHRKDLIQLLIQLKNLGEIKDSESLIGSSGKQENGLTMNELTAQAYIFFVAGFETSATLLSFALYEIAANQNIQDKLRNEIKTVLKKYDNKFTYEAISEMRYLQNVVDEALRKYPSIPTIGRICTIPFTIPDTSVVIEKGTSIIIPVIGFHYDPEYYPNPEIFDPERFSTENKSKRPPCTYLPFGDGPRNCIGMRFGLLQGKIGIASIINCFKLTVNSKTELPFEYVTRPFFVLSAKGKIWIDIVRVNE